MAAQIAKCGDIAEDAHVARSALICCWRENTNIWHVNAYATALAGAGDQFSSAALKQAVIGYRTNPEGWLVFFDFISAACCGIAVSAAGWTQKQTQLLQCF
jgi:hypothetical protein